MKNVSKIVNESIMKSLLLLRLIAIAHCALITMCFDVLDILAGMPRMTYKGFNDPGQISSVFVWDAIPPTC